MASLAGIRGIGQVSVPVRDLAAATRFYRDVLGFGHLFTESGMAHFDTGGGVRLMLAVPQRAELVHPSSIVYFRVEDIEKSHAALGARGIAFEVKPHVARRDDASDFWLAFFRDPDRNILALMADVPRPAPPPA